MHPTFTLGIRTLPIIRLYGFNWPRGVDVHMVRTVEFIYKLTF